MKHWVFDLDGTLVDSFSHYFKSLEVIFGKRGKAFGRELYYPALTDSLMQFLIDQLGENQAPSAMQEIREMSEVDAQEIRPFSGIVETLDHLKTKGARLAVWTNRDFQSASLILEHSGLKSYFDAFVSGSCVTDRKPHPEGLIRILKEFEINEPHTVTMVGDHEHDVFGAKQVTARSVRASWHQYWKVETCREADHQFYSVNEFSDWVVKG